MDPSLWVHQHPSHESLSAAPGSSLGLAITIILVVFAASVWMRARTRHRVLQLRGTRPKGTEAFALLSDVIEVLGSLLRIPLFAFGLMAALGRLFLDSPNAGSRRF